MLPLFLRSCCYLGRSSWARHHPWSLLRRDQFLSSVGSAFAGSSKFSLSLVAWMSYCKLVAYCSDWTNTSSYRPYGPQFTTVIWPSAWNWSRLSYGTSVFAQSGFIRLLWCFFGRFTFVVADVSDHGWHLRRYWCFCSYSYPIFPKSFAPGSFLPRLSALSFSRPSPAIPCAHPVLGW